MDQPTVKVEDTTQQAQVIGSPQGGAVQSGAEAGAPMDAQAVSTALMALSGRIDVLAVNQHTMDARATTLEAHVKRTEDELVQLGKTVKLIHDFLFNPPTGGVSRKRMQQANGYR